VSVLTASTRGAPDVGISGRNPYQQRLPSGPNFLKLILSPGVTSRYPPERVGDPTDTTTLPVPNPMPAGMYRFRYTSTVPELASKLGLVMRFVTGSPPARETSMPAWSPAAGNECVTRRLSDTLTTGTVVGSPIAFFRTVRCTESPPVELGSPCAPTQAV